MLLDYNCFLVALRNIVFYRKELLYSCLLLQFFFFIKLYEGILGTTGFSFKIQVPSALSSEVLLYPGTTLLLLTVVRVSQQ